MNKVLYNTDDAKKKMQLPKTAGYREKVGRQAGRQVVKVTDRVTKEEPSTGTVMKWKGREKMQKIS